MTTIPMTPASSTYPSDAEVIERVQKLHALRLGDYSDVVIELANLTPDLISRLRAALTRISSLERELGASDAALRHFGEIGLSAAPTWKIGMATENAVEKFAIEIEAARRRSAT